MKSLLKFAVLSALLISGKLTKQPVPAALAQNEVIKEAGVTRSDNSVVLVHQVLTSEPVRPGLEQTPGQAGGGFLAELF